MSLSVWELLPPVWELRAGWEDWRDKGTYRQNGNGYSAIVYLLCMLEGGGTPCLLGGSPAGFQGGTQGVNPATLRQVR